jgi:hypothetical protein
MSRHFRSGHWKLMKFWGNVHNIFLNISWKKKVINNVPKIKTSQSIIWTTLKITLLHISGEWNIGSKKAKQIRTRLIFFDFLRYLRAESVTLFGNANFFSLHAKKIFREISWPMMVFQNPLERKLSRVPSSSIVFHDKTIERRSIGRFTSSVT